MAPNIDGVVSTADDFETVPDAIVYADPETGEIVEATGGVAELFGREPADLVGRNQTELHPAGERDAYRERFEAQVAAEPTVLDQLPDGSPIYVRTPEGRVPVEINACTVERDGRTLCRGVFRDVTERLHRDRIREQYREAVESTASPIAAVDADYRYLFANEAYCEPLDHDQEDIDGRTIREVLGPSVFESIRPKLEAGLAGETCQYETERTFPSGESRVFEATYSPLRTAAGEVYGLIASLTDVTERTKRERELERLFDGMEDAAFVHHLDGTFEVVNETAVDRYGYTEAELREMSPRELDAEPEAELVGERIETIHETGSIVFETVHESKSGQRTPVEISSALIQYKGEPAILSIARDISRRKESERKFEVLFNNASDAMVHTAFRDDEPIVRAINPAFADLFGVEESTLVGQPLAAAFHTRASAYEMGEINRRIRAGDPLRMEIQRQTPDGARDFLLRSIPVDPESGEYYRVYTDITERKERERTLVRQRDELGTLNRLNELILAVIQELVAADSRSAIERVVCRELAASPLFEFAWIAEPDPETGEAVMRTCATDAVASEPPEEFEAGSAESGFGPAGRALDEGEIQVVQNTNVNPRLFDQPEEDVEPDIRSVAAVPLAQDGTVYATLVIYAPREFAFSGRELAGLETLGKIVEFAINAVRNRKLLTTNTVAELTFDVGGSALPLVGISSALACRIEVEGSVGPTDDRITLYLEVSGCPPEQFLERLRDEEDVAHAALLGEPTAEGYRVETTMDCELLRTLETHHKARMRAIELDAGVGEYVVDAPLTENVREIVDRLQAADPAVSLTRKREREERVETAPQLAQALEADMTDRQTEILQTALLSGYFEWPRDSTAEDVADTVGISSSTVQYHLRNVQKTVFGRLFGRDE